MSWFLKSDLIEDSGVTETPKSFSISRSFFVGCTPETRSAGVQISALTCPGLPQIGYSHPIVPLARCMERVVHAKSDTDFLVVCKYEWARQDPQSGSSAIHWSVGAVVNQIESSFDIKGKKMVVAYKPNGAKAAQLKTVVGSIWLPSRTIRGNAFERQAPFDKSDKYTGSINKDGWGSGEPRQWMCTGITGESVLLGASQWWDVTYEFQFRRYPWVPVAVIRDIDGSVPGDVDNLPDPAKLKPGLKGNGWACYEGADEVSFGDVFGNPT